MKKLKRLYKTARPYLQVVSKELFHASLVTYLILLMTEKVKTGFVSFFFNLDILLVVVLVSGIVMVLTEDSIVEQVSSLVTQPKKTVEQISSLVFREKRNKTQVDPEKERTFYYILCLSIASGAIVYFKTGEMGVIALLLSVLTGLVVLLISYLIISDDRGSE